jgi:hypothetical protein
VVYPAKASGIAVSSGALSAGVEQDYCWMWRNKAAAPVSQRLVLKHRK